MRVAQQVLVGGDTGGMAHRIGVSPHTVKSQLRGIYAKTRMHRQGDLLKLLLCMPGV